MWREASSEGLRSKAGVLLHAEAARMPAPKMKPVAKKRTRRKVALLKWWVEGPQGSEEVRRRARHTIKMLVSP